jgi:hypothetical protein
MHIKKIISKVKKNSISKIVLFAASFFVAIVLIGYFYLHLQHLESQKTVASITPVTTIKDQDIQPKIVPDENKDKPYYELVDCSPYNEPGTENWKTYIGESGYTQDGSTIFCIKYPAEWLLEKNTLYPIGKNPDKGLETKIVLGAGGRGAPESQEVKQFPGGKARYYLGGDRPDFHYLFGYATFSGKDGKVDYIFEFNNIPQAENESYEKIINQMLATFRYL